MQWIIAFFLVLSSRAYSQIDLNTLQKNHCQFLFSNDGTQRFPVLEFNEYFIQNFNFYTPIGKYSLVDSGTITDFIVTKDRLWTVGSHGLQEFNLEGELLETHFSFGHSGLYYHQGMERLYLSSGRSGLTIFDLKQKKIIDNHSLNTVNENGHLSRAVGITGDGKTLYIAMTGDSEKGFNGVITYDILSNKIISKSEYDRNRAGVIDPHARIYHKDDIIYLNNGGWIHQILKKNLQKKTIRPKWLSISYEGENKQYIMMTGDLMFSNDEILGCGEYFVTREQRLYGEAFARKL